MGCSGDVDGCCICGQPGTTYIGSHRYCPAHALPEALAYIRALELELAGLTEYEMVPIRGGDG